MATAPTYRRVVIDGMMNRFHEFVVKRAFAPEGSNVALSTGDVSMVQGVFSRRMALVNAEHVLELSTDMRRLFKLPISLNGSIHLPASLCRILSLGHLSRPPSVPICINPFIQHEASLMVLHNFAGDAGMRDKLAKDFPNETVVLRERMMASVDKLNETISEIGMNTNDAPMFMPKKRS